MTRATHEDFKEAVKLHKLFLDEAKARRAKLTYPRLDERERFFYLLFFDAFLGKEDEGGTHSWELCTSSPPKGHFGDQPWHLGSSLPRPRARGW